MASTWSAALAISMLGKGAKIDNWINQSDDATLGSTTTMLYFIVDSSQTGGLPFGHVDSSQTGGLPFGHVTALVLLHMYLHCFHRNTWSYNCFYENAWSYRLCINTLGPTDFV